ncbi:MAG: hypothetical protein NVS4B8_11840 [Herpetosiphon sp.]
MLLNGVIMDEWDTRGRHLHDDVFLIILNAHHEDIQFTIPGTEKDSAWRAVIDTSKPDTATLPVVATTASYQVGARSIVVLQQPRSWLSPDTQPVA